MQHSTLPVTSIVIPAYNAEETLEACIASVLCSRYPREHFEIIVIDNASADRTASIIRRFDGKITALFEPKRGAAAARNTGIRRARGSIIAFTDADCTVDGDWLYRLTAPLVNPAVGATGGRICAAENPTVIEKFGERIHDHERAITGSFPPYLITMNCAARRADLEQLELFDERFLRGQDVDLSFRMARAGHSFLYEPGAIVFHRNESTLRGLFHEGWLHGFHGAAVLRHHAGFLEALGRRPPRAANIRALPRFLDTLRRADRLTAACLLSFRTGKNIGKLAARVHSHLGERT